MTTTALPWIITLVGLTTWSCKPKDPEFTETLNSETITISDLLGGVDRLRDKEITLKVFLVKHIEGPWLADDIKDPLKDLHFISVTSIADCKFFAADGSDIDYWDTPNKKRVLARGHLRVGDYKNPVWGMTHKDHPYFELKAIIGAEQAVDGNPH